MMHIQLLYQAYFLEIFECQRNFKELFFFKKEKKQKEKQNKTHVFEKISLILIKGHTRRS